MIEDAVREFGEPININTTTTRWIAWSRSNARRASPTRRSRTTLSPGAALRSPGGASEQPVGGWSVLKPTAAVVIGVGPVKLATSLRCAAAATGLIFASCQVAPIVHLVNMSGQDVHLSVLGEETPLSDGQEVELEYPYSANGGMSIRYGQCVLWYMPPAPPNDFMRYRILRPHLNVRLERDWTIVVLAPREAAASAPPVEEQPEGFPLVPERSGACG